MACSQPPRRRGHLLNATRALKLHGESAPLLPRVPQLEPLYQWGMEPRQGQFIEIAGRPGSQKSGFVLFWVAQMGLPTLYFSADMTPMEVVTRLAAMETGEDSASISRRIDAGAASEYERALMPSQIEFAFGQPITWVDIMSHIDLWVEVNNSYPPIIVIDNLMDIEGCEGDYQAQTQAMQDLTGLCRDTGSTVIVLHHASDKGDSMVGAPPARKEIKNGLAEKPQLVLTVALSTEIGAELRVAIVKQRSGRSDPAARSYVRLKARPELCRFEPGPREWYTRLHD